MLQKTKLALICILVIVSFSDVTAQTFSYKLEPQKTVAYNVTITAETPTAVETFSGMFALTGVQTEGAHLTISYSGGLSKSAKLKSSNIGFPRGFGGSFPPIPRSPFDQPDLRGLVQSNSEIVITEKGGVKGMRGNTQLPYLLGNLSLLPFESLPAEEANEWKSDNGLTITSKNDSNDDFRFGRFGPFGVDRQERVKTGGGESTKYTVLSTESGLITVQKDYSLTAPSTGANDPGYQIEGHGTWVFNSDLGMSEKMEFKAKITISEDNTEVRIPITVQWNRMPQEEYDAIVRERQEKHAALQKEAQERLAKEAAERKEREGKPLNSNEKREIIADLSSANWPDISRRLHRLNGFVPHPSDFDVALKIKELRSHKVVGVSLPAKQLWEKLEKVLEAAGSSETAGAADNPFATAEEKNLALAQQMRVWSDSSGTYKVEAQFQRVDGESVILLRRDGKHLAVPYARLSSTDQKIVDSLKE